MQKLFTIHYAEIALKGGNRGEFERKLIDNIRFALRDESFGEIERDESRILLYLKENSDVGKISEKLRKVFGIAWFSPVYVVAADIEKIKEFVKSHSSNLMGKKLRVEAKRSDKSFPLTSPQINAIVGEILVNLGHGINLSSPDATVYVDILRGRAHVYFEKFAGLGGLPVGSSGKVLVLLSGGIDSPLAAWLMLKRGCETDFLHIRAVENTEKISGLVKKLREYSPKAMKLYNIPYDEFYKKTFELGARSELVLFKRFLLHLACEIARKEGYLGIVTGDNLAQVASQTLDNLYATDEASSFPVYRPLLTYDKNEIIVLARKAGTYELSLEEYKDCCSLVSSKHPETKSKLNKVQELEEEMGIKEIVAASIAKLGQDSF